MKKVIELIPNTRVEINTDKNGKSVILYSDNNEEGKFKDGDFISTPNSIAIYKNNNSDCDTFNVYTVISDLLPKILYSSIAYDIDIWGLASESEIQRLKDALKNEGYYWDEGAKEIKKISKISKIKEGDYIVFKIEKQIRRGIIVNIHRAEYPSYDIFVPLEDFTFYEIGIDKCYYPAEGQIKCIDEQMLKIGKKWDGENIVDIFWKPNNGEKYYCINGFGEISKEIYDSDYPDVYGKHLGWGNCFKTGEEAYLYSKKIKELLTNRNK